MLKIILLEIAFFLGSLISSYLTWGPMTSREMVEYFSPPLKIKEKLSTEELYERKRKAGVSAEMLRAFLVTLIGILVIPFYSESTDVSSVLYSPIFRWSFFVALILCLLWNIYFGPYFFAIKHCGEFTFFSKSHFKKYIRPYLFWWPYPLFVFAGIGLLTLLMVIGGIAADIASLQSLSREISNIPLATVEDVQYAIIRLIEFGSLISVMSQKYVLATLFIFIYVIIEQRSSMRYTILDASVERLKYFVWGLLIFTVGFSLVVLPSTYETLHSRIQDYVRMMSVIPPLPEHLNDVLSIQKSLEEHDLKWVFLKIVTSYGNILTASIVGVSVFVWKSLFKEVKVKYIVRLIVPKYLTERMERIGENFVIDMNIENEIGRIENAHDEDMRPIITESI